MSEIPQKKSLIEPPWITALKNHPLYNLPPGLSSGLPLGKKDGAEGDDSSVEFDIPPVRAIHHSLPVKDMSVEEKTHEAKNLLQASEGFVEVIVPQPPKPVRNIETGSAQKELAEEMKLDLVSENNPENESTNSSISPEEQTAFETVLEKELFLESEKPLFEESTFDAPTKKILETMIATAISIQEKIKTGSMRVKDGEALQSAVYHLSERLGAAIDDKTAENPDELEKFSKELKTIRDEAGIIAENGEKKSADSPEKKEAWMMSAEEFATAQKDGLFANEPFEGVIRRAYEDGKPIPPETLEKFAGMEWIKKEKPVAIPATETTPATLATPAPEIMSEEKKAEPKSAKEPNKILAEISTEVSAQFEKDFAMAQEDLKNIVAKIETPDGGEKVVRFSDLTSGQQLLLLENLKDFALENAKAQALKGFTEDEKKRFGGNAGFLQKAWWGISKTYRRAKDMAQIEKDILEKPELEKGNYAEVLREMVKMANDAPEAEWKDGKFQVNFALSKDFEGLEMKELLESRIRNFNKTAGKLARIPMEWAYSKDEREQKQYEDAKSAYADVRGQILDLKSEGGKENEALAYVADLDKKIHFSQLFNTHPGTAEVFAAEWMKEADLSQAPDAFEKAKNQNAKRAGWKAFLGERGGLMAGGYAVRTIAAAGATSFATGFGISTLGGPLGMALYTGAAVGMASGGFFGAYMARKRAKLEISDTEKLAGIGVAGPMSSLHTFEQKTYDYNKDTNEFAEKEGGGKMRSAIQSGADMEKKLEYALNRVWEAEEKGDDTEKEKAMRTLGDRLYYTEQKLIENLVNYGEGADARKNYYELNLALAKARTLHEMNEPEMARKIDVKIKDLTADKSFGESDVVSEEQRIIDVKEKIDALLDKTTDRIAKTEKDAINKKGWLGFKYGLFLGGLFGAGLSGVGYELHGGSVPTVDVTPKIPPQHSDGALLEKILPNTGTVPKDTLANEILEKIKFAKNYELSHGTPLPVTAPLPAPMPVPIQSNVPHDGMIPEAVKIPKDIFPEPHGHGFSEAILSRAEAIEKSLHELGKTHTVAKGDTIWEINKSQLGGNEYWNHLNPRQQNFVLDTMRHDLLNRSREELIKMGIKSGDINLIRPGDNIDMSKVFDKDELTRIFTRAENLHILPSDPVIVPKIPHVSHLVAPAETLPQRNDVIEVSSSHDGVKDLSQNNLDHLLSQAHDTMNRGMTYVGVKGWADTFEMTKNDIPVMDRNIAVASLSRLSGDNFSKAFYSQEMKGLLATDKIAQEHYVQFMNEARKVAQETRISLPEGFGSYSPNDTVEDYYARMQGWKGQFGVFLPKNFPDFYSKQYLLWHGNNDLKIDTTNLPHGVTSTPSAPVHSPHGIEVPKKPIDVPLPLENTATASFKTSLETWSILPEYVKNYIATVDGQVGKNIDPTAWGNMRALPAENILRDMTYSSVRNRVLFLQNTLDVPHHPDLATLPKETLEHYLARLANRLWLMNSNKPPEIPKNL